jgi:cytoskeletal protein RodZ
MANNTLKYRDIDLKQRSEKRESWNKPLVWPLSLVVLALLLLLLPAVWVYRHKKYKKPEIAQV